MHNSPVNFCNKNSAVAPESTIGYEIQTVRNSELNEIHIQVEEDVGNDCVVTLNQI